MSRGVLTGSQVPNAALSNAVSAVALMRSTACRIHRPHEEEPYLLNVYRVAFQKVEALPSPGYMSTGAEAASAPRVRCGYLSRCHADAIPPYDPPSSTALHPAAVHPNSCCLLANRSVISASACSTVKYRISATP